jgi:uncharacterized OsmC-like protein
MLRGLKVSQKDNLTKLKMLKGYKFRVEFDGENIPNLIVDEAEPIGLGTGPNPTRLLAAAVGHCISSSLIFCMQKARVEVIDLETTVKTSVARNEEGRWRVSGIDVQLHLEVNEEDKMRAPRCLKIFEDYCTVTQSVRKGIPINIKVVR